MILHAALPRVDEEFKVQSCHRIYLVVLTCTGTNVSCHCTLYSGIAISVCFCQVDNNKNLATTRVPKSWLAEAGQKQKEFEKAHNIVLRGGVKAHNGAAQVTVLACLLGLFGNSPPRDFTDVIAPCSRRNASILRDTSFHRISHCFISVL